MFGPTQVGYRCESSGMLHVNGCFLEITWTVSLVPNLVHVQLVVKNLLSKKLLYKYNSFIFCQKDFSLVRNKAQETGR